MDEPRNEQELVEEKTPDPPQEQPGMPAASAAAVTAAGALALGALAADGSREAQADPCTDTPPPWADISLVQRCVTLEEAREMLARLMDEGRAMCVVTYDVVNPNVSVSMCIDINY